MLIIKDLSYMIEKNKILENINLHVKKGKFVGLIGANGSGKSTILKNIYNQIEENKQKIFLENLPLGQFKRQEIAKKISVLIQNQNLDFDFSVEEIVAMGRYVHRDCNEEIIEKVLKEVGLEEMRKKSFLTLSGGEKQRVFIARALAQETEILILDEPTNHLDIQYQLQIMDIIKKQKKTVLAVIHDMNIASVYCDYIFALKKGRIIAEGTPKDIFTTENIKNIFEINAHVITHPTKGIPYILYL
jgi:iron complex transport system ATP-binding protein